MIKSFIMAVGCIVMFSGCYSTQPSIEVVPEYRTKLVLPDDSYYKYVNVPTLSIDITEKEKDEVIDDLVKYSIKLQTVIMRYEERTDALTKWKEDMKKVYEVK